MIQSLREAEAQLVNEFAAQHPIAVVALVKIVVLLFLLLTVAGLPGVVRAQGVGAHPVPPGPYRVGPHGLLQPLADVIKFLIKEDPTPDGADRFVYYLAPLLTMGLSICAIAVIPFGPGTMQIFGQSTPLVVADVNIGLLIIFALTSLGVYGVVLAGWSSNNKYSLLGGLRSSAQMISYELSLTLSVVGVLLLAGTFHLREIVAAQSGFTWGFLPRGTCSIRSRRRFSDFSATSSPRSRKPTACPSICRKRKTNWSPDFTPNTAAFKFGMFFIGEYANMVTVACLAVILFLGGWLSPCLPARHGLDGLHPGRRHWHRWRGADCQRHTLLERSPAASRFPSWDWRSCALAILCAGNGVRELVQGPFWFLLKVFVVLVRVHLGPRDAAALPL